MAGQTVQVRREGRDEGLALAGLHLCHPAEVERCAAHQLDVVVALAEDAVGGFTRDGKGLHQEVVEGLATVEPFTELDRAVTERVVVEMAQLVAEGIDVGDDSLESLELLALSGAEDAIEDSHAAASLPAPRVRLPSAHRGRRDGPQRDGPGPPAPVSQPLRHRPP